MFGSGGGKKKGAKTGGGSGSATTKEQFISQLGLIPHPEGGFFCETYRSGSTPMASKARLGRYCSPRHRPAFHSSSEDLTACPPTSAGPYMEIAEMPSVGGQADNAHHILRCHLTQEIRVQNVDDDEGNSRQRLQSGNMC
jgi:hypothetical protein